jgi:16S rRNA (adenine1518-N6/adenine1519-N6)-dimethyltransferase
VIGPELLGARRVRELLSAHGVNPTKTLGQNFVIDPNTIRKAIAAADVLPMDHVLEIGAGAGSLTVGLARVATRVTALEVDPGLIAVLHEVTAGIENVDVVEGDARTYDLGSINPDVLVANLPYNIAALVVLRVLESVPTARSLTVMTQREVGERLSAPPGSKTYGQTSVLVAFHGAARVAGSVSRRAFWPVPGVDSVLVRIDRRPVPDVDRTTLYNVVKSAFGQRRKTLRQALATLVGSPALAEELLRSASVASTARAEELPLEDFVAIARELQVT